MKKVQCKKCRYLLKDKDGYNWCPNKLDDPDVELLMNCEWYVVKTNADRIRAMTNDELVFFFWGTVDGSGKTVEQWRKWLKQECDDNGT